MVYLNLHQATVIFKKFRHCDGILVKFTIPPYLQIYFVSIKFNLVVKCDP